MLFAVPIWTNRWKNVDSPCEYFGPPPNLAIIKSNSRIAYCISMYPREANGGIPFAFGSSEEEKIKIKGIIDLERQGTKLQVNNKILDAGQTDTQHFYSLTLNPWLLSTTELSITNEGVLETVGKGLVRLPSAVIFVSGNIIEGWKFTLFGLLYFVIGLSLIILNVIHPKSILKKSTEKSNTP